MIMMTVSEEIVVGLNQEKIICAVEPLKLKVFAKFTDHQFA